MVINQQRQLTNFAALLRSSQAGKTQNNYRGYTLMYNGIVRRDHSRYRLNQLNADFYLWSVSTIMSIATTSF